jgi:uncharacterized membrane protein YsdA (DUF1294 family)
MEFTILLIYILVLWTISIIVTIYDKIAAIKKVRRIPEKTLLILAAIGGAGGMLITMKAIRHKTRKLKFMIPLPLFTVIHLLLTVGYCYYFCR